MNTNCVVAENVYQSDTYVSFIAFCPDSVHVLTPSHIGLLMWGVFLLRSSEKQTGQEDEEDEIRKKTFRYLSRPPSEKFLVFQIRK